jgi:hypothetical protein
MSHEGRTPPHPGKHPALVVHKGAESDTQPALSITAAPQDWRHPGPRYLQPDTEWPERAECNF